MTITPETKTEYVEETGETLYGIYADISNNIEYVEETGETLYGIYANVSNQPNRTPFNEVITELFYELVFYKLNRNEHVERKCRFTDRNVNKKHMDTINKIYLEDIAMNLFDAVLT